MKTIVFTGEQLMNSFSKQEREFPFTVGRADGSIPISRFSTLKKAEAEIVRLSTIDPKGVFDGEYYVDGPEELINGSHD